MFTRKQYLNSECTHAEYYGQFVTDGVKRALVRYIPLKMIKASTDPHFNDIQLSRWDALPALGTVADKMRKCGDYLTLAGSVCVYKQAARQMECSRPDMYEARA